MMFPHEYASKKMLFFCTFAVRLTEFRLNKLDPAVAGVSCCFFDRNMLKVLFAISVSAV